MGPSGSGKSTLLNIIGLLDRPDRGVYRLEDVNTTDLTDEQQAEVRRLKIGFIFQFFHLIPRLTAAENVELPLILAGIDPARRKQRVAETLDRALCENYHYAHARNAHQLEPATVTVAEAGARERYRVFMTARGAAAGTVKFPALCTVPGVEACLAGRGAPGRRGG